MDTHSTSTIVVLHEAFAADARSDELDALTQVREVSTTLRSLGWQVECLATDLDLAAASTRLRQSGADCVFNLVESLAGKGELISLVPSVLKTLGIPFTGSSADAIFLSSQKLLAKRWMAVHGIATPKWLAAESTTDDDANRWIVKSVWEHASLGLDDLSVVQGRNALRKRLQHCRELHGGEWFAERFIDGREFNISLIEEDGEPRVLPVAEISFENFPARKPKIVGYDAKWNTDTDEYRNTPRVFPELSKSERDRLTDVAKKCWRIFGLGGYARVDVRMDNRGVPWVLEINANPCLSNDAGFVAAAAEASLDFEHVIETIVTAAIPRQSEKPERSLQA
jgi:D-alanine-D-alanine ligase